MTSPIAATGASPARSPAPLWWRSVCLGLGTASALGLSRFGYGLVLPAMRAELGWNLAQAGTMTTANGLGYLAGAVAAARVARLLSTAVTFRLGMIIIAAALAATAASTNFLALLAARAAAGLAGALVFITGGVVAARLATGASSTTPITIYFAGTGLGIVLSGAAIPGLLDHRLDRWPLAWLGLAVAAGLATVVSWTAAGSNGDTTPAATGARRVRPLSRVAVSYVLFAAGYIAYITFLSAYLTAQGASARQVALTWSLLGLGVVAAPVLWNRTITRRPGARVLRLLLVVLAAAAMLPLLWRSAPVLAVSTVAYGATFMTVPAAVTALIRADVPRGDWIPTLAAFTALFAAGQTIGPWAAGSLADHTTTGATLAWTAALCLTAAAVAAPARAESRPSG